MYADSRQAHDDCANMAGTAPQWIELLPAGEFTGRDGRGPYRLSDPVAVVAATRALRMDAGIPIDYDHATDFAAPEGRPAPAAGWIRKLAVRDGAIWGQVEWTDHGAAAVATHEYRYISPVFEFSKNGEVTRLLRAALTNNPNLYLGAISASRTSRPSYCDDIRRNLCSVDTNDRGVLQMDELMAQLREILGLDAEAGLSQAVEQIRAIVRERTTLNNSGVSSSGAGTLVDDGASQADPARFVPITDFQSALTELNSLRAARARERAEHTVNEAIRSGRLTPAQREWAIAYCQADEHGFKGFIARQPSFLGGSNDFANRAELVSSGHPERVKTGAHSGAQLSQLELAVCSRLGLSAEEFARRKAIREDTLKPQI
jgi:phage I-like protein